MIHGNIPFTSFRMEYIHMNETYLDKAGNLLDICMSKFCLELQHFGVLLFNDKVGHSVKI